MFNREELAWAAGIIEGEGCLAAVKQTRASTRQLRVDVAMTDLDILQRLQAAFGVGVISGPRTRGSNKPIYSWRVCNFQDAQAVMASIYGWLGHRRRQQVLNSLTLNAAAQESLRGRGFCKRNLHFDLKDRAEQSGGYFCRPCAIKARSAWARDKRSQTRPALIRTWARVNGYRVSPTGRLSPTVVRAYDQEHADG